MARTALLIMVTAANAALAQMPAHMQQSAQAAYQQQQWQQQQQMLGQIQHDRIMAERAQQAQQQMQAPRGRPVESRLAGLSSQYGALAVSYRDDILLDNYSKPLPFSWQRYRNMTSEIDGQRLENLSPFGPYQPFRIHAAGEFRNQPESAQQAEAAARERCGSANCEIAAVYANTCNAIAAGWLKDYSGVRLYTASRAHFADGYRQGDVNDWNLAYAIVQPAIEDALRRCQGDPAVHAASCTAPDHKKQAYYCALPSQHLEWQ
ncbi:MAG: hypothetical protein Q4A06_01815 [Cardiobacteriaceae bacterium]|nr:hypothetical protein [Cardiobacteriaceae bacterium]